MKRWTPEHLAIARAAIDVREELRRLQLATLPTPAQESVKRCCWIISAALKARTPRTGYTNPMEEINGLEATQHRGGRNGSGARRVRRPATAQAQDGYAACDVAIGADGASVQPDAYDATRAKRDAARGLA